MRPSDLGNLRGFGNGLLFFVEEQKGSFAWLLGVFMGQTPGMPQFGLGCTIRVVLRGMLICWQLCAPACSISLLSCS